MTRAKKSYEGLMPYETGYEEGYNKGFEDCKHMILDWMKEFIQSHSAKEDNANE